MHILHWKSGHKCKPPVRQHLFALLYTYMLIKVIRQLFASEGRQESGDWTVYNQLASADNLIK